MAIRYVKSETEKGKVVGVDCIVCGYPNVVRVDKYGRLLTRCPKCGLFTFYRGPESQKWLESRFKEISLEGLII
jgi:predicted  nucleic acid-binding Zn-ribbon protein